MPWEQHHVGHEASMKAIVDACTQMTLIAEITETTDTARCPLKIVQQSWGDVRSRLGSGERLSDWFPGTNQWQNSILFQKAIHLWHTCLRVHSQEFLNTVWCIPSITSRYVFSQFLQPLTASFVDAHANFTRSYYSHFKKQICSCVQRKCTVEKFAWRIAVYFPHRRRPFPFSRHLLCHYWSRVSR